MKKQHLQNMAAGILVLLVVFGIARRIIPRNLESLMPKDFYPESCHVNDFFASGSGRYLTKEETQSLWSLMEGLEYRHGGRVPGGVMKGELYHVSFFQLQEPVEHVYLFVTKTLGVIYLNDREYKMLGDTKPLLDFLDGLN
jgi:hypothetical protein